MKYTKEICIRLLSEKQSEKGELPKKSDFAQDEVMAIKSFFGPWTRALESAGLKEARNEARIAANREKRVRAKQRKRSLENQKKEKQEE